MADEPTATDPTSAEPVSTETYSPGDDITGDLVERLAHEAEADATTASPAAPPTPEASPDAPPTAAPPPSSVPVTEPEPVGPLPLARHKEILENTRTKTRNEVLQEYGFGPDVKPEVVAQWRAAAEQHVRMDAHFSRDPAGFVRWLQSQIPGQTAPPVQDAPAKAAPTPPTLKGLLQTDDGKVIATADEISAYVEARVTAATEAARQAIDERFRHEQESRAKAAALESTAQATTTAYLTHLRTLPQFAELEPDIRQAMVANPHLIDPLPVYNQLWFSKIYPTLTPKQAADAAAQIARKGAASTISPSSAAPITPGQPAAALSEVDEIQALVAQTHKALTAP